MNLTDYFCDVTGLTPAALFGGKAPLIEQAVDGSGKLTITSWTVPGVPQPTSDQIAAALASTTPSLRALALSLNNAVSSACSALTLQVVPDSVHRNAYVNAAAMVGPTATVPTEDPMKTAFATMAGQAGIDPPTFAKMVVAIAAVSCQLQASQAAVTQAASAAKSASDLSAALTAFENAIGAIVSAIQSAGVTITAPAAISIVGINA